MARLGAYLGQGVVYALVALVLGTFSNTPAYRSFPADSAELVLSFSHGAARKGDCRRLTPEEIAALAPNMRRPEICPRERVPVTVRLALDEQVMFEHALPPGGIAGDGPSRVYRRFTVPAGRHLIAAALRDTERESGFDYAAEQTVTLAAGARFVVDFKAELGGFTFDSRPVAAERAR